jgi:lipid-binding SYLF domain-containing protein
MRSFVVSLFALTLFTTSAFAFEPDVNDRLQLDVQRAIIDIKAADPGIQSFFDNAAGYAVFPSVGKGGVIIGGAFGRGLVLENEQVVVFPGRRCPGSFQAGQF